MKFVLLFLTAVMLSGCTHLVSRQISIFPHVGSREVKRQFSGDDVRSLRVDGTYFQRAVLEFALDDSGLKYVNRRLEEEDVRELLAVRIVDFGFSSKTQILGLPLAQITRYAFIEVEFERLAVGGLFRSRAELEVSIPPADKFLSTASHGNRVDNEALGDSMSAFVGSRMRACVEALVAQLKRPNKAPEPTPTAVMPRATSAFSESKRRNDSPNRARVMPAVVVARL